MTPTLIDVWNLDNFAPQSLPLPYSHSIVPGGLLVTS